MHNFFFLLRRGLNNGTTAVIIVKLTEKQNPHNASEPVQQ
jgi:hypothetical protein